MRTTRSLWLGLLAIAWLLGPVWADPAEVAKKFEAANRLTAEGKFTDGAAAYDALPMGGRTSAALEYNRAAARLKAGEPGAALAHLRLAERLAPRDAAIGLALEQASARLPGNRGAAASGSFGFLDRLTLNEWAVIALVTVWVWGGMFWSGWWRDSARLTLRGYTFGAGLLAVASVGLLSGALATRLRGADTVVLHPETTVRVSPLDEARGAFSLGEGAEVRSRVRRGEWMMVEEPGSRRFGWVKRSEVFTVPLR